MYWVICVNKNIYIFLTGSYEYKANESLNYSAFYRTE
jgi:hypothetical protein